MPTRKPSTDQEQAERDAEVEPGATPRPGEGLDRSTEAVIEAAREHPQPEPETDRQDRRTIDTKRSG